MKLNTVTTKALGIFLAGLVFCGGLTLAASGKVLAAQTPSGSFLFASAKTPQEAKAPVNPVNINTATQEELETVRGIGPVTAARIVNHREANGLYKSVEDIAAVKGIGEKKMNRIKDGLTV